VWEGSVGLYSQPTKVVFGFFSNFFSNLTGKFVHFLLLILIYKTSAHNLALFVFSTMDFGGKGRGRGGNNSGRYFIPKKPLTVSPVVYDRNCVYCGDMIRGQAHDKTRKLN
jgi:hypothetical protein